MGATGVYSLKGHKRPKDYFDDLLTREDEEGSTRVLKSTVIGRVWYGAVEKSIKSDGTSYVLAGVITFSYRPKDRSGEILVYKVMDETMGPVQTDCPSSILKLLTDPLDENAKKWREQCQKNRAGMPNVKKLANGVKIRLETPLITRDGREISDFKVLRTTRRGRSQTVYMSDTGELWRLTRIDKRPFKVIDTPKKTEG